MREFSSFGDAAAFLGEVALTQHAADKRALEKATKIIQTRAKAIVGEYQTDTGPFVPWAELADATKNERVRLGFTENDPGLRTGEMRDSIERNVADNEGQVGSNDDKLVWFELGTSTGQPPRSVLGAAAFQSQEKVVNIVGEEIVIALVGDDVFKGRMEI